MSENNKVTIIIPSCNEPFLQKTIDSIFEAATGDIEVIAHLDAYWPEQPLKNDDRLIVIHSGNRVGMRGGINKAVRIANGKYIMKCDAHCNFDKGFDEKLKADCKKDWVCIPSRYSLDMDTWEKTRGPVDYLYLTFPFKMDEKYGAGFHGKKWKGETGEDGGFFHLDKKKSDVLIDEIIAFQGSCWFMHKEHFNNIDGLDEVNMNVVHQEAQEICFKTWLSGGKVIRNKKTWYSHLHKGKKTIPRGYFLTKHGMKKSEAFSVDLWMNDKWPKQIKKTAWLINKFLPMDGWPADWEDKKYQEVFEKEYGKVETRIT